MTITQAEARSLFSSPILAGRVAEEIDIQAAVALADIETLTLALTELRERLALGSLDAAARTDIATDLVACSDRVLDFALAVAA